MEFEWKKAEDYIAECQSRGRTGVTQLRSTTEDFLVAPQTSDTGDQGSALSRTSQKLLRKHQDGCGSRHKSGTDPPERGQLKDPKHQMTPGPITDDASMVHHEVEISQ